MKFAYHKELIILQKLTLRVELWQSYKIWVHVTMLSDSIIYIVISTNNFNAFLCLSYFMFSA